MGKINILGFDVANLIAAGEVVDRPSSVVKELIENSIDSGADSVTVEIQNGGVTFIRVSDNGCGMDPDDLPVAILRHATSKIKTAKDLSAIGTLGFRGEALAAIASVSKIRIFSKPAQNPMGAMLECEGGGTPAVTEVGCADGTTVVVEDLFYNVPARRKFLKRDATEAAAVSAVVERIALSRPDVAMKYISDGVMKFVTSGKGELRDAIYSVFGRETANRSLKVTRESDGVKVTGYVSEPDLFRPNRNYEITFVNGRLVKSRTMMAAVEQAYKAKIPPDRFPFCVLNLEVSPAATDVNVHPAKLEVKFTNEKIIFDAVYYAVKSALEAEAIRPELDAGLPETEEIPAPPATPGGRKPFRIDADEARRLLGAFVPADGPRPKPEQIRIKEAVGGAPVFKEAKEDDKPLPVTERDPNPIATEVPDTVKVTDPGPVDPPEYVIIGEAFNCYVILELKDRLLFVDKHAAHERILFEELCRNARRAEKNGQIMLEPVKADLAAYEGEALRDFADDVRALGFDFTLEDSGSRTNATITQIPEQLDATEAKELFATLASRLADTTASVESASAEFFEARLFQSACKAAVKGGRKYGIEHIKWICDRLLVKNPDGTVIRTCPHGRPVAFEIKKSSIDRQFGRLGN